MHFILNQGSLDCHLHKYYHINVDVKEMVRNMKRFQETLQKCYFNIRNICGMLSSVLSSILSSDFKNCLKSILCTILFMSQPNHGPTGIFCVFCLLSYKCEPNISFYTDDPLTIYHIKITLTGAIYKGTSSLVS